MRILAVDDDPSILELLDKVLDAFGYKDVVTARSGREAIEILSRPKEAFDCLLLDVQMPQMNGITLCEEVRKLPEHTYTPIIMVTAMVQKEYIDEAFGVGATDYVTKPFEFSDLKQRLSDAYRMAAERRAAIEVLEAEADFELCFDKNPDVRLSDPQCFGDLPGFIGLAEFENYVVQLSTMHSKAAKLVAVKCTGAEQIYKTSTVSDFRRAMALAGTAVLSANQEGRKVATYWGNGVFLVIYDNQIDLSVDQLGAPLPEAFKDTSGYATSGRPIGFQVSEEVMLDAKTKMEALFLIDKAVEMAEMSEGRAASIC